MDFEKILKDVQDTLVVTAEIERRQSAVLKEHSEWLEEHDRSMADSRKRLEEHEKRMAHIDQNLSEITDKLNGLIGWTDDFIRRNPPQ